VGIDDGVSSPEVSDDESDTPSKPESLLVEQIKSSTPPPKNKTASAKAGEEKEGETIAQIDLAIRAAREDELQGMHADGGVLSSTTVPEACLVKKEGQTKAEVIMDPLAVVLPGVEIGERTARPRFPQMSEQPTQVFSNSPINLIAAEAMRNVEVGDWCPWMAERETFSEVHRALQEELFCEKHVQDAMVGFASMVDTLPKKMSVAQKERLQDECLQAACAAGAPFTTVVKAFVKKETSGKPKPRPIADHGFERLVPLAKVAWVYEHIVAKMRNSNIKGREKGIALKELFTSFSSLKNGGKMIENDLTAFEFGVSEVLKKAEQSIIYGIALSLNLSDVGFESVRRVIDARDKTATWSMNFVDAAGERQKLKIKLPRPMRESGDRLTSSGNWLQNVMAWFSYLSAPRFIEDPLRCSTKPRQCAYQSVKQWVKSNGKNFFYISARDAKEYVARLAFEGDDTAGALEEDIDLEDISAFFKRWGWKSKLRTVLPQGDDYLEFVGIRALISDGKPTFTADGDLVAAPPIKRFLQEKAWSTIDCTDAEFHGTMARYACEMAKGFRGVGPLYAFCRAMYDDHRRHDCSRVSAAYVKDLEMSTGAEFDAEASLIFPPPQVGDEALWKRWATASAGKATDAEWAAMCGVTTLEMHGKDLAVFVPRVWLS
jgi:hypothetical protein